MAKFPPFNRYLRSELDALIAAHGLEGPFLDGGCGPAHFAAHLARRGWSGVAVDNSPTAIPLARRALGGFGAVEVVDSDLESFNGGPFNTIILFDVMEHVEDDGGLLEAIADLQEPGGKLVLTVPTNQDREWRWDDDLWGHLRRYDPDGMERLLCEAGYRPMEMWDVTFPFFWMMRRAYTALKSSPPIEGTPRQRTINGHLINPWDFGPAYSLISSRRLWRPFYAVQRLFRENTGAGHEMMVLAERVDGRRADDG